MKKVNPAILFLLFFLSAFLSSFLVIISCPKQKMQAFYEYHFMFTATLTHMPQPTPHASAMQNYRSNTRIRRVSFASGGATLAGELYLPSDFDEGKQYPAVVLAGSWTSVKEQMAGLYAARLAEAGFVGLAFDFFGWGESAGEPRHAEIPERKIADVVAAAKYLRGLPFVDDAQVGALGICAGAGYVGGAANAGAKFTSIALVAPWLHKADIAAAVYGGEQAVATLMRAGEEAAQRFAATGKNQQLMGASKNPKDNALMGDFDYYANPSRGQIPQWPNRFSVISWKHWLAFDAVQQAQHMRTPVLLVHSRDGAIPQGAQAYYDQLPKACKKKMIWLEGASQDDFYDNDAFIAPAVQAVAKWMHKTGSTL